MSIFMGVIDSALGMMYGTLSSPILVLIGYATKLAVPSVTMSQAVCDLVASIRHHQYKNGNFSSFKTRDSKLVLSIVLPGILAVVLGVFVAVKLPTTWLNLYIGILVTLMGVLCLRPIYYAFAWWKIWLIGILSSFNKAISGGGFGPVTVTGKILGGVDPKISVATTILSKGTICALSTVIWFMMNGWIKWQLPLTMCVGGAIGALFGPYITKKFDTKWLRVATGCMAIICGLLVIILKLKA